MSSFNLQQIQEAIRQERLDGWLFSDFKHRDPLSEDILSLPANLTNSRPWIYAVPARGEPLRIVHTIELDHLDTLPGKKTAYMSREDLFHAMISLAGKRWGVHLSEDLPAISLLDAGTARLLEKAGIELVSAAGLVQRFKGLLSKDGIASHERAAEALYDIIGEVWNIAKSAYHFKTPLYENDLRQAMLDGMKKRELITDHPPIVGAGVHSGNPHYDFDGKGSLIEEGDLIQFDLWAKENTPGAIYADISWLGFFGKKVSDEIETAFKNLLSARDRTFAFIQGELEAGRTPSGAMADEYCRKALIDHGYEHAIMHRTGHGIDTECHGFGVNIDSVEFPDVRLLLDGSCFSLEPGIYFSEYGMRSEIDVYIANGKAVISGKERQQTMLIC
ncbi:MAG: M24 family metallopeptidase [Treponema sp.]|jgi:Xaa-Pro aminopeptidase|nr:M24 family metallopeptidase [Treponema sp.]